LRRKKERKKLRFEFQQSELKDFFLMDYINQAKKNRKRRDSSDGLYC
jgi:hypothetical protein